MQRIHTKLLDTLAFLALVTLPAFMSVLGVRCIVPVQGGFVLAGGVSHDQVQSALLGDSGLMRRFAGPETFWPYHGADSIGGNR